MLQVGFLWGDFNHRFSLPFVFGSNTGQEVRVNPYRTDINLEDAASVVLNPYRITICDGGQQPQKTQIAHYPVSRKSDLYSTLNERCRTFCEEVIFVPPESDVPIEQWGDLVSRRGVLIEFRASMKPEIIKWLFDRTNSSPGAPSEINKLLIIPEENAGKQAICLYVLANDRIVRIFSPSANFYDMQKLINDGLLALSGNVNDFGEIAGQSNTNSNYSNNNLYDDDDINYNDNFVDDDSYVNEKDYSYSNTANEGFPGYAFASNSLANSYRGENTGIIDTETGGKSSISGGDSDNDRSDSDNDRSDSGDGVGVGSGGGGGDSGRNDGDSAFNEAQGSGGIYENVSIATNIDDAAQSVSTYSGRGYIGMQNERDFASIVPETTSGDASDTNGETSIIRDMKLPAGISQNTEKTTSQPYDIDISVTDQSQTGQAQQTEQTSHAAGQTILVEQTTQTEQAQQSGQSTRTGQLPKPEQATGQAGEQTAEQATLQSTDKAVEQSAGKTTGQTTGQTSEQEINKTSPSTQGQPNTDAGNIRYMTINEVGGGRFPGFSPDVFCIVEGPKTSDFRRIRYTAPTNVRDKSELENIILSSDIYSYNRSIDYNDTLVFKNITSIYRLYKDGFMEYNYIPLTLPGEKGGLAAALENAISYILNIERPLLGSADLFLSGIYENETDLTYRFTFDYIIDDYPVYFRYEYMQGDKVTEYKNAITIQSNANRVVSCHWMLVDLFFATDTKKLQIYFDRIEVGQSFTRMSVSDISIAYNIDMTLDNDASGSSSYGSAYYEWPVWVISSPDGSIETVKLSEG